MSRPRQSAGDLTPPAGPTSGSGSSAGVEQTEQPDIASPAQPRARRTRWTRSAPVVLATAVVLVSLAAARWWPAPASPDVAVDTSANPTPTSATAPVTATPATSRPPAELAPPPTPTAVPTTTPTPTPAVLRAAQPLVFDLIRRNDVPQLSLDVATWRQADDVLDFAIECRDSDRGCGDGGSDPHFTILVNDTRGGAVTTAGADASTDPAVCAEAAYSTANVRIREQGRYCVRTNTAVIAVHVTSLPPIDSDPLRVNTEIIVWQR